MTITPAHDQTDFEIAQRHNLDFEQVIDFDGKLLPMAGEFAGMHINKARPLIVEKLQKKGLVTKVDEKYMHAAAINSRGGETIEPQIMMQWFIDVNKKFELKNSKIKGVENGSMTTLKELMRKVVENDQIEIMPKKFEKTYFHWIDNLRDWNISRQIWYGHQIPVWYKGDKIRVGEDPKDDSWQRDPDTLDTWFSSGLWSFSTLGWPEETKDLKTYHPTSVLETGYDILPFWVARMILMSTYHLGEIPFEKVYFHGMVRDEKGKKMSKSVGNAIDPLDMIEKFGTDALRLAMIVGIGPGNDISLSEDKVKAYKHFSNKIWNASRFVLSNTEGLDYKKKPEILPEDEKNIKELDNLILEVTKEMDEFKFYLAGEKLYHYFWHTFADKIIEESKSRLDNESTQWTLMHILRTSLRALHPFTPFITEEIWKEFDDELLMIKPWPNGK
jgi:valyl-tRNA synthetase